MATLINGNGNLAIYAQQDADWYAALMGGQTVITAVGNQFAYELLDANTIGVKDGVIITTEGRRIQLDANAIDSFDIPTGAQGTTNYYIIGYHLVTGDLSEQTCETFVQLMENGTDTIPEGSFRDGDDEVFISLYRVEQDDLTIGTITALLPQLSGSFQSQITELNNDLTDNGETFRYGYDPQTGQRGYYIESGGADTFVPFKIGRFVAFWLINTFHIIDLKDGTIYYNLNSVPSKFSAYIDSFNTNSDGYGIKFKNGTTLEGVYHHIAYSSGYYNKLVKVNKITLSNDTLYTSGNNGSSNASLSGIFVVF